MSGSEPPQKSCRDCGRTKPLRDFPPSKKNRDGRTSYCRPCTAARARNYRRTSLERQGKTIRTREMVPEGSRRCPTCNEIKTLDEFPRNRAARTGRGAYCKPCHNKRGVETYTRLYGSTREYHLRGRYGIGQADVDAMVAAQDGVCAACREDEPKHVDHDHATGRVRGILCFLCNQALGNVRDDVRRLEGLISYLRRASPPAVVVELFDPPPFPIEYAFQHRAA